LDFQNALDPELFCACAVRFVPVRFGTTYRTIRQLDRCVSFQLSPTLAAIEPS